MNRVDSSAWREYFTNGPDADTFAGAIEDISKLVVPSICVLEVFKKVLREQGEDAALQVAAQMQLGSTENLDTPLALSAARLGLQHRIPLADSVVLATARRYNAVLWTQDEDFEGIENVRYYRKKQSRKTKP